MKAKPKKKTRWEVEWQELTKKALRRKAIEAEGGPLYEHDIDRDEVNVYQVFETKEPALKCAREIVDSGVTVYGHATVQEQEYVQVEGTVLFDWEGVGEPEYVS